MSFYSTIHAIKDRVNWELYGLHLANLYAKVYSLAGQARLLLYRLRIILAAQVQVSFPFQVSVSKFSSRPKRTLRRVHVLVSHNFNSPLPEALTACLEERFTVHKPLRSFPA